MLFYEAFCVMISWSVWIGWQQKFNNDSNRKSSESPLQFSRLDLSAGPILMIIAFIVAVFNAIIQVLHFISAIKREAEVSESRFIFFPHLIYWVIGNYLFAYWLILIRPI